MLSAYWPAVYDRRPPRVTGQPVSDPVDLGAWRRAAADAQRRASVSRSPTAGPRPPLIAPRLRRWLLRLGLAAVGLGLLLLVSLGLLAYADFTMAGNGSPDVRARAQWVWDRGDHLHFAVHIIEGRIFDLCPCTRRAADAQYFYAHFHAVTPHQGAVAANTHPASPQQWVDYVTGPFVVAGDWIHDGIAWLGGQRPPTQVTIALDDYEMQPAEIHIARGTRVIWRNVDAAGEAHTVTAAPRQSVSFDSDFLEPDESFAFTFTERGRYLYYCRAHGTPDGEGMAGLVVVE